jgi:NADP-dependent 3-hydroxy acid dehydrogenase YdfG
MPAPQVWLITGTSSGFGAALVQNLLVRGDKVIATARSLSKIEHFETLCAATLQLDVTASTAELENIAKEAIAIYGRIDVPVNNAGYSLFGTFEDAKHDHGNPIDRIPALTNIIALRTGRHSLTPTYSVRLTPHVLSCLTMAATNQGL